MLRHQLNHLEDADGIYDFDHDDLDLDDLAVSMDEEEDTIDDELQKHISHMQQENKFFNKNYKEQQ